MMNAFMLVKVRGIEYLNINKMQKVLYEDIFIEENKDNLKFNRINEICSNDLNVLGYIISYGLTDLKHFLQKMFL